MFIETDTAAPAPSVRRANCGRRIEVYTSPSFTRLPILDVLHKVLTTTLGRNPPFFSCMKCFMGLQQY